MGEEKTKGLKLACRYSFPCERAVFCLFSKKLFDFARGEDGDVEIVKKMLEKLSSYLDYFDIAQKNKIKNLFDERVVSYYWKGAPVLKGECWHNFTTLLPIKKMPVELIDGRVVENCLVNVAQVVAMGKGGLCVKYHPISKKDDKLCLSDDFVYGNVDNGFGLEVKSDDFVTIHFSKVIEIATEEDFDNMREITKRSLEKFNALNK